jgi:hypothetical protein
MRYNESSNVISCYASGQKDIALYMLEETEPEEVYTEVRNTLEIGRWYTICLEKEFTAVRGATLWDIEMGNDAEITLVEAVAPYAAGRPYFFRATAAAMEVVYGEATTTVAGNHKGLYGTFGFMNETNLTGKYILSNNQLWYVDGNETVTLNANRAFIVKDDIPAVSSGDAPSRRRMTMAMPQAPQTPTGIDVVDMQAEGVQKVIVDGHFYIVRDGKMYDAAGRLVK